MQVHDPKVFPPIQAISAFPHADYVDSKEGWIKLNANEAPYPPSPAVLRALHRGLERGGEALGRYPEPTSPKLKLALAQHYGLCPTEVLLGNGSQSILEAIFETFCQKGDGLAYLRPDYPLYTFLAQKYGLRLLPLDFSAVLDHSPKQNLESLSSQSFNHLPKQRLEGLALETLDAPVLCFSSPHWPTGFQFTREAIQKILERFRGIVILDEAYVGFARQADTLSLLAHYPRLIILRSFSKAYALANLRIAYALGSREVLKELEKRISVYSISSLAEAAGLAALKDTTYYTSKIQALRAQREASFEFLASLGWQSYPSEANFLLTQPKGPQGHTGHRLAWQVYAYLKTHKILVRPFQEEALTGGHLRISIGTASEMTILHHTLKAYPQGPC